MSETKKSRPADDFVQPRGVAERREIMGRLSTLQMALLAMNAKPEGWFADGIYEDLLKRLGGRLDQAERKDEFPADQEARDAGAFAAMEEALKQARNSWSKGDSWAMSKLADDLQKMALAARHPHQAAFQAAAEACSEPGYDYPLAAMKQAAKVREDAGDLSSLGEGMIQAVEVVRLFVIWCLTNQEVDDVTVWQLQDAFALWTANALAWDEGGPADITPAMRMSMDAVDERNYYSQTRSERNVRS